MARQRSYTGNFSGVQGVGDVNLSVDNREFVEMCDRLRYEGLVRSADIRKVFARVAKPVKVDVQRAARSVLGRDRRKAWKGVRVITLKKGQGVVVGLLNPRKAGNAMAVGGNSTGGRSGITRKRKRSARTNQVDGYQGADRSFILRMHNQGTDTRMAGSRDGNMREANRGRLTARKFFDRAEAGMQRASKSLAQELGKIIEQKSKKS
jgi:hypothetical protein